MIKCTRLSPGELHFSIVEKGAYYELVESPKMKSKTLSIFRHDVNVQVLVYWKIGHRRFSLVYAELSFPGIVFIPPNCVVLTIGYAHVMHIMTFHPPVIVYGFVQS